MVGRRRRVGEQGVKWQLSGCVERACPCSVPRLPALATETGPLHRRLVFLLFRQSRGGGGGGGGVLRPTADNVPQLLRYELTDLLMEIGPSLERQTRWWENVGEDPRRWSPVGV